MERELKEKETRLNLCMVQKSLADTNNKQSQPIQPSQTQFVGENQQDTQGGDVSDDEPIGGIERRTEGSVVGQFGTKHSLVHHPAKEDAHDHAADRHDELGHEEVEEVEEVQAKHLHFRPIAKRQGAEGAEHEAHQTDDHGCQGTGKVEVLMEVSDRHLQHGNAAGECRQHQQQVENQGEHVCQPGNAAKHLLEDVGQGDEDQRGACIGTEPWNGIDGWENDESAEQSHQRVDAGNTETVLHQVNVLAEITGVGAEASDSHAEREECLPHGAEDDRTRDLGEIGMEQEREAKTCIGQGE